MTSASKCLLWLTALTTASLTVTGCDGGTTRPVTTAVSASAPSPVAHSPRTEPHPRPTLAEVAASSAPSSTPEPTAAPTTEPATARATAPQRSVLVMSDGSRIVHVGGRAVQFPGTVTDAVASPNGLALAFVDGQGNIALARLDGTGVRPLTATDPGVRRAQPTFEDGGSEIVFSERGHDGVWRLKEVASDGHDDLTANKPDPTVAETRETHGGDTAASATWFQASHADTARSVMVFQHRAAKGPVKVYVSDRNQRGFGAAPLLNGRAPAVSSDGSKVAFIGHDGQIEVQSLALDGSKTHPTEVTWSAHPTGHLAWSPDGRRIAFSTGRDVESVASTPARPGRNPVRVVLRHPGVASFAALAGPLVGTYGGDPVRAAVDVSRAHYVDGVDLPMDESSSLGVSSATRVVLVSATDPSAAAPAAAMANAQPILFVRDGRLAPRVRREIVRLLTPPRHAGIHPVVDIVGSTSAVPDSVASQLQGLGLKVRRFDPTAAAADALSAVHGSQYGSYVVVSATDLPAIVSSVGTDSPVLLTDGSTMPAATAAKLDRMPRVNGRPTVYAVGEQAQAAVRSAWSGKRPLRIVDLGGPDPYANSLAAVQGLYDAPGRVAVATATDWQDSLIATMVGPALVVDEQQGPEAAVQSWLAASQAAMRQVYVLGGPAGLARTVGHAAYGDRFALRHSPTDILQ